ncbi:hypothetical protein HZS_3097 [Henneguya salminicola]|nr:hypothetical protein HZS_3097 [Henneguya salminicola]
MNDPFLNSHINICMFVEVIRNEFEFYEQRFLEIKCAGVHRHSLHQILFFLYAVCLKKNARAV